MQSVTDESVEKALNFMRDNARSLANARARAKYLEQKRKSLKASAFIECSSGTVAEREAHAYRDSDYLQCLDDIREAVYDAELLTSQFKAAELRIEVWRTLEASSRKGHV